MPEEKETDGQILERIKRLEETIKQLQQKLEEKQTTTTMPSQPQEDKTVELPQLSNQALLEINTMNLPDSLRRTMLTIAQLKEATPEEVAEHTNRTRGLENIYLNQLERLGYIEKIKRGKRVYFRSTRPL
jgi:hypothetical protein